MNSAALAARSPWLAVRSRRILNSSCVRCPSRSPSWPWARSAPAAGGTPGAGRGRGPPPPSGPPPPAPTATPPFLDGATGAATPAQIVPAAPRNGEAVTVTAAGYLTRQRLFTGTPIQLWHATEDYVHDSAYTESTDHSFRTIRWPGAFVVTLDGDLASNDAVVAK